MVEETPEKQPRQEDKKRQETQELLAKIQALEATGQEDKQLLDELHKRGVNKQVLNDAWQQHIQDFPEHEHEQAETHEENLEERLQEVQAQKNTQPSLYDISNQLQQGQQVDTNDIYNAIQQTSVYVQEQGSLTDNQQQAINTIEQTVGQYINKQPLDELKHMGKLKIGDSYLQNN